MKGHGAKSISFALVLFAAGDVLGVHDTGLYYVAYQVSGEARQASVTYRRASVTYVNAEGGTQQDDILFTSTLPNTFYSGRFMPGKFVSVSAQSRGDEGIIVVKIFVEGKEVRRSESEGAYVIASAHFTLPD